MNHGRWKDERRVETARHAAHILRFIGEEPRRTPGPVRLMDEVIVPLEWGVYRAPLDDETAARLAAEKVFERVMKLRQAHPDKHVEIAIRVA